MKGASSRIRDCVDDSARSAPVLRGIIALQYGNLLDRVDAQVGSQDAAGCAIGIVVDAQPVQPVAVLLGSAAGDTNRGAEAVLRHMSFP